MSGNASITERIPSAPTTRSKGPFVDPSANSRAVPSTLSRISTSFFDSWMRPEGTWLRSAFCSLYRSIRTAGGLFGSPEATLVDDLGSSCGERNSKYHCGAVGLAVLLSSRFYDSVGVCNSQRSSTITHRCSTRSLPCTPRCTYCSSVAAAPRS